MGAYKLVLRLIKNKNRTEENLLNMADVYFAVDRITEEEYKDLVRRIEDAFKAIEELEETEYK